MSDPILLLLTLDAGALLLLGACAAILPFAATGFLTTAANGLAALLCLPPLLMDIEPVTMTLPAGPPGLSLHLAIDPLAAFCLLTVLLGATAIAAFQANTAPLPSPPALRQFAFSLAGAMITLLAADGVTLSVGLAILCGAVAQTSARNPLLLLTPFLFLAAISLLTPPGFAPRFDAIRAAPIDTTHAIAALALGFAAVILLTQSGPSLRCPHPDALTPGVLVPTGSYLLLRLAADLTGAETQAGTGFVLLLAGSAIAVIQGWRAAGHPDLDGAVIHLSRRQAGLIMTGMGIAMIARAEDLPGTEAFALAATCLTTLATGMAGVLTALATGAIGASAGTLHLSRLGGLIHTMPATSTALALGLLALSPLPPGMGFAGLWLLYEALLGAPRTGGLLFQLPLALADAALALSAALAVAASVRMTGIALLGRPRTPRGAGARETGATSRIVLIALSGAATAFGIFPSLALWALADPAIHALTGAPPNIGPALALLRSSASSPGYLALPVLALLALATGAVILWQRRINRPGKPGSPWMDGMQPPVGLPFGEPAAQSVGDGFLPALPAIALPTIRTPALPNPRPPSPATALWLLLATSGLFLLLTAMFG